MRNSAVLLLAVSTAILAQTYNSNCDLEYKDCLKKEEEHPGLILECGWASSICVNSKTKTTSSTTTTSSTSSSSTTGSTTTGSTTSTTTGSTTSTTTGSTTSTTTGSTTTSTSTTSTTSKPGKVSTCNVRTVCSTPIITTTTSSTTTKGSPAVITNSPTYSNKCEEDHKKCMEQKEQAFPSMIIDCFYTCTSTRTPQAPTTNPIITPVCTTTTVCTTVDTSTDIKTNTKTDIKTDIKTDTKTDIKTDTKTDTKTDIKTQINTITTKDKGTSPVTVIQGQAPTTTNDISVPACTLPAADTSRPSGFRTSAAYGVYTGAAVTQAPALGLLAAAGAFAFL